MAIQQHTIDLEAALRDLKMVTHTLEGLHTVEVRNDDPKDRTNRPKVADITRDLLFSQHLLDAVKVSVGDEYWSIRGRG
jgi:hypothetical protein